MYGHAIDCNWQTTLLDVYLLGPEFHARVLQGCQLNVRAIYLLTIQ